MWGVSLSVAFLFIFCNLGAQFVFFGVLPLEEEGECPGRKKILGVSGKRSKKKNNIALYENGRGDENLPASAGERIIGASFCIRFFLLLQ